MQSSSIIVHPTYLNLTEIFPYRPFIRNIDLNDLIRPFLPTLTGIAIAAFGTVHLTQLLIRFLDGHLANPSLIIDVQSYDAILGATIGAIFAATILGWTVHLRVNGLI